MSQNHTKPEHTLNRRSLSETEAQVLWAFCGRLKSIAQNADHSAFMLYSEIIGNGGAESAADFRGAVLDDLGEIKGQLIAIGKLLEGGIEALHVHEIKGRAAA